MNTVAQQPSIPGADGAPVRERETQRDLQTKPSDSARAKSQSDSSWTPTQADSQFKKQPSEQALHAWLPSQFEDIRLRPKEPESKHSVKARKNIREYTTGEEIANAISHGLGIVLAIVAIPTTIVAAVHDGGGGLAIAAALIYSISMLLEYTASTLYHALTHPGAKKVFKVLDHCGIYLFIAGTYTPFCLVPLYGSGGVVLCIVVWAIALVGITLEAFWVFRPRWVSVVIYLALGWCVIWCLPSLITDIPLPGLILVAAGGVSYTVGCIFYVLKKVPYMHTVFHLFVLAASILQYLAVVLYAL